MQLFLKNVQFLYGTIFILWRDIVKGTRHSRKLSPIRHPKEDGTSWPTPFFSSGSSYPRRCSCMDTERQFIYLFISYLFFDFVR